MFRKILVPIDIQRPGDAASILKVAGRLAAQFSSAVHVTTVMPGYGMPIIASYFPADAKTCAKRELEERLRSLVAGALHAPATVSVSEGRRAEEILKTAARRKVDLILVGRRSRARAQDAVLGSVGTKVAQRAKCSVIVVRL